MGRNGNIGIKAHGKERRGTRQQVVALAINAEMKVPSLEKSLLQQKSERMMQ
jgi:hypothetical protein